MLVWSARACASVRNREMFISCVMMTFCWRICVRKRCHERLFCPLWGDLMSSFATIYSKSLSASSASTTYCDGAFFLVTWCTDTRPHMFPGDFGSVHRLLCTLLSVQRATGVVFLTLYTSVLQWPHEGKTQVWGQGREDENSASKYERISIFVIK